MEDIDSMISQVKHMASRMGAPAPHGHCGVCSGDIYFDVCECGGPTERACKTMERLVRRGEAAGRLEAAATRFLIERDQDVASYDALMDALESWLDERRKNA